MRILSNRRLALLASCLLSIVGWSQGSTCSAIREYHARDFNYEVVQTRGGTDTVVDVGQADLVRMDTLLLFVDSQVVEIETRNWSFIAYRSKHFSLFKHAQTEQGYFFSPRDPLSVLYFALDNGTDTTERTGAGTIWMQVKVKENSVSLTRVEFICEPTGRIIGFKAWYAPPFGDPFYDEFTMASGARDMALLKSYAGSINLVAGKVVLSGLLTDYPVFDPRSR